MELVRGENDYTILFEKWLPIDYNQVDNFVFELELKPIGIIEGENEIRKQLKNHHGRIYSYLSGNP